MGLVGAFLSSFRFKWTNWCNLATNWQCNKTMSFTPGGFPVRLEGGSWNCYQRQPQRLCISFWGLHKKAHVILPQPAHSCETFLCRYKPAHPHTDCFSPISPEHSVTCTTIENARLELQKKLQSVISPKITCSLVSNS